MTLVLVLALPLSDYDFLRGGLAITLPHPSLPIANVAFHRAFLLLPYILLDTVSQHDQPSGDNFACFSFFFYSLLKLTCCSMVRRSFWFFILPSAIKWLTTSKAINEGHRVGGGAQLDKPPTLAQVMISWLTGSSPGSGSVLTAQSLELALRFLCLPLSLPLPRLYSVSLCLSQK